MVPFPPGGSADLLARALAEKRITSMGQPVLIDNKPGAGGIPGAEAVATKARLPNWPQIPIMRELGSAISVNNLWGIAGPKGLPTSVFQTLESAFKFAMEQPSVIAMLQSVEQKS